MEKTIGNIVIRYSEKDYNQMVEISDIIEKNESILKAVNRKFVIDLSKGTSKFDLLFEYIAKQIYGNDRLKSLTDDEDVLSSVYFESLIRHKGIENPKLLNRNHSVSDEFLSTVLAYAYFDRTSDFDSFVEYIKHRYADNAIMDWAKELLRDNLYNIVIDDICESLNDINENYIEQMVYILDLFHKGNVMDFNTLFNRAHTKVKYQPLSESEFDKMVYEFFNYIDAPKEWIEKYEYLKRKNYITNEETELDESKCFYNEETNEYEIKVSNKNDINGFCSFIHEFTHYVISEKGLTLRNIMVSEFPSIYFEMKASEFLKEKGYDPKIVDDIILNRKISNYGICLTMGELFDDIVNYSYGEDITVAGKVKKYEEQIERFERVKNQIMVELDPEKQEMFKNLPVFEGDYVQDIKDNIDKFILKFLKKGFELIQGYEYLLDTYLVNMIREVQDEEEVYKLYSITSDLANYDVEDILNEFGIDNLYGMSLELK